MRDGAPGRPAPRPSPPGDPVLAAASELEMVVCMHVGSSSRIPIAPPESPFTPATPPVLAQV
jgi:hypothetical protein